VAWLCYVHQWQEVTWYEAAKQQVRWEPMQCWKFFATPISRGFYSGILLLPCGKPESFPFLDLQRQPTYSIYGKGLVWTKIQEFGNDMQSEGLVGVHDSFLIMPACQGLWQKQQNFIDPKQKNYATWSKSDFSMKVSLVGYQLHGADRTVRFPTEPYWIARPYHYAPFGTSQPLSTPNQTGLKHLSAAATKTQIKFFVVYTARAGAESLGHIFTRGVWSLAGGSRVCRKVVYS
jgi:hypothetical protein